MKLSWRMVPTFWKALHNAIRHRVAQGNIITPRPEVERREAICAYCSHNQNGQCALCGCALAAKVWLRSEKCPDTPPRWTAL